MAVDENREWAAAQTVARLFHCLDGGDYDGVAGLFADDGIWVRMDEELNGPAAVRAAMATRPATLRTRHLVTNMLTRTLADGSVEARYYITVFDELHDGAGPASLSVPGAIFVCTDRLVPTGAGWRFASRRPVLAFRRAK